jgi:hypothetical protein
MINIYYNKPKEIGFAFFVFSSNDFVLDYQEFGSENSKHKYLQESRAELLICNLEVFSSSIMETPTETHKLAIKRIKDYIVWANKNRSNRAKIFEYYTKVIHPFVNDLASCYSGAEKIKYFAMACMMYQESVDAYKYEIENIK